MYKSSLEEIASKDGLDVLRVDIDAHKEFAGEAGSIINTFFTSL
ncbi:hypothetical protein NW739_04135 [Mycoplasmopsis felis]|nr:hypothetical protein [Mycoplasmopsis felis]MCU9939901.1 hypothetical protein [Mycoplasmopsis felis]